MRRNNDTRPRDRAEKMKLENLADAGVEDDDQDPENREVETNRSTPTGLSTCLLCLVLQAGNHQET